VTPPPADDAGTPSDGAARAVAAITATGIKFSVTHHGPVSSLAEAAAARGLPPSALIKTMVVRRADDDYVLVLVPGDRSIAWAPLRAFLGVSRLTMADGDTAYDVTGYRPGTITPFGTTRAWPVIVDAAIPGRVVSIGGGASGTAFTVDGDDLVTALGAQVAEVAQPVEPH
jgi:Cys-tRNA(Pro) deacylase